MLQDLKIDNLEQGQLQLQPGCNMEQTLESQVG